MKILLPIDDSPCSQAAVTAVVEQFAPAANEIRLVHADEWPRGLPTSLAFAEGPGAVDDILSDREKSRRRGGELLAAAERRLRDARFRVHTKMVEGDPEHAILDAANEWHPDLIVMGSHGRHGLDRLVMGSVSERIVRYAPCSVEVIRAA
jgi:nucleotide-binding universal stress UspA family protein